MAGACNKFGFVILKMTVETVRMNLLSCALPSNLVNIMNLGVTMEYVSQKSGSAIENRIVKTEATKVKSVPKHNAKLTISNVALGSVFRDLGNVMANLIATMVKMKKIVPRHAQQIPSLVKMENASQKPIVAIWMTIAVTALMN